MLACLVPFCHNGRSASMALQYTPYCSRLRWFTAMRWCMVDNTHFLGHSRAILSGEGVCVKTASKRSYTRASQLP
jgi:hypothetical protein